MKEILTFLLLLLTLTSCNREREKIPETKKQTIRQPIEPIRDSLSLEWPLYPVFDSLELKSLNSTVYLVGNKRGIDGTDYLIIRDHQTKQHYKIILGSWPAFNSSLTQELQLKILENDTDGQIIKPVNYEWLGLESFLNNCKSLENQELNPSDIDAIIKFSDSGLNRLNESFQIDTVINRNIAARDETGKAEYLKYSEQKRVRLKKKIIRKNVLIYEQYGSITFIEINPGRNIYCLGPYYDPTYGLQKEKIFYNSFFPGNNYNLVLAKID